MDRGMNKAERLREMERMYFLRPYADEELARHFGVSRQTIFRNRTLDLELEIPFVKEEPGRWKIDSRKYLSTIRVNMQEALSLYLAARRMSQQTRFSHQHFASALKSLALTLKQPMLEKLEKAAEGILNQKKREKQIKIFENITEAWVKGQQLRIEYQGLYAKEPEPDVIDPYLIEPSPWSDSIYVIGYSKRLDRIMPLKLERILRAVPSKPFSIPDNFDEQELLKHAWGIWSKEGEPQWVKLHFHSKAAIRRLKESIWHPCEEVNDLEDGSCTWEAPIAEPEEMLPWIRGWGADVEVLEPIKLRESLMTTTRRLARGYGLHLSQSHSLTERLLRCWGKTEKIGESFHPALYHMFDVGHVAQQILSTSASMRWQRVLAHALGAEVEHLKEWLPWFIAMHDIGKVSVPFQAKNTQQEERLKAEGFQFGNMKGKDQLHHTDVGRYFLKREFDQFDLPENLHCAWLEMIGGHHGIFGRMLIRDIKRTLIHGIQEPPEWQKLRKETERILQASFLQIIPDEWPEPTNVSAAIMALTGFTILCDWLGSDNRYFSPRSETDIFDYITHSRQQARKAVSNAGLFLTTMSTAPTSFEQLFPDRLPARPLQRAIDQIPESILQKPCLAIIEAPTGEGKTEAALALAHRLAQHSGTDEFYCALPTTATSNQMFKRIQTHLQERLNLSAQANLVHGQAFLVEDDLRIEPSSNGDGEVHASLEWFAPKKKALLAPFGVGTIDQAELAALNVRHNALRLIGLAGKVVILDEVHAYDTYMTTIIEQMLRWLSALGSSVILLSATLPKARRAALAQAYGVPINSENDENEADTGRQDNLTDYPSLWIGNSEHIHQDKPAAYQPQRPFQISPLHIGHDDALSKAQWLLHQVDQGGCACWITNTVDRAQDLFDAIRLLDKEIDCLLLHARFPLEDRQSQEKLVTDKYGPNGERPQRTIVIGTQVLEQSLDLDFDLMASDLAPIDLLLQRMGRLHRHKNTRPAMHQVPHLYINCELDDTEEMLQMGADQFYTEYILQKTWLAIRDRKIITLPDDYRPLVEAVYDETMPSVNDPFYKAWKKLDKQEARAEGKARERLLPEPDAQRSFCANSTTIFEEDDGSTAWIAAQTRLDAESVTVIPLEKEGNWAKLTPSDGRIELTIQPSRAAELQLLRRSLRINRWEIVQYFKQEAEPTEPLFKKSSLLKSVQPLWLTDGEAEITYQGKSFNLILDSDVGLRIQQFGDKEG